MEVADLKSVIMLARGADCAAAVMTANAKIPAVPANQCFVAMLFLRWPSRRFPRQQRQGSSRPVGIEPLAITGVDPEQPAGSAKQLLNVRHLGAAIRISLSLNINRQNEPAPITPWTRQQVGHPIRSASAGIHHAYPIKRNYDY